MTAAAAKATSRRPLAAMELMHRYKHPLWRLHLLHRQEL